MLDVHVEAGEEYRTVAMLLGSLRMAERHRARTLADAMAARAWRVGDSGLANAATCLAAALAEPDRPYLGALRRLLDQVFRSMPGEWRTL